jgi:hypothetical protein
MPNIPESSARPELPIAHILWTYWVASVTPASFLFSLGDNYHILQKPFHLEKGYNNYASYSNVHPAAYLFGQYLPLFYEYFSCNGDIPKTSFEVKYSNAIVQYFAPPKNCRLLDNHLKGTSFIAKDIAI